MALNSEQLKKILEKNEMTKPYFRGVYPACMCPKIDKRKSFGWIMNNQAHDKKGEHWLLWFYSKRRNVLYFADSFGRNPLDSCFPHSFSHIINNFEEIEYLSSAVQGYTSWTCGYFVVHAFLLLSIGLDLHNFRNEYGDITNKNDYKVLRIVKSLF